MERVDIVTPLCAGDLERFAILRDSIAKNWEVPGTHHVFLHAAEFGQFSQKRYPGVVVHTQEDVHGNSEDVSCLTGWYRQQLVKLGARAVCDTPFYLCLDASTFVARPTCYGDVVKNGKAVHHTTRMPLLHALDNVRASAALLDVSPDDLESFTDSTTTVMSSEVCAQIQDRLESLYGVPWQEAAAAAFVRRGLVWFEYLVYHAYLLHAGILEKYHVPVPTSLNCNAYWGAGSHLEWDPAVWEGDGFIGVFTSKAGPGPVWVRRRLVERGVL